MSWVRCTNNSWRTQKILNVIVNGIDGDCNVSNRAPTSTMMQTNHFVGSGRDDRSTRSATFGIARIGNIPVPRVKWPKATLRIVRLDLAPCFLANVRVKNCNFLVHSTGMLRNVNIFTNRWSTGGVKFQRSMGKQIE